MALRNRAILGQLRRLSRALVGRGVAEVPSTPPTITSSATFQVPGGSTAVGTVTATDGQTPYDFSISGGVDAALFDIDADTGVLIFLSAPDFFDPLDFGADNVYDLTVRVASSGGAYAEQNIAVTVVFSMLAYSPAFDLFTEHGTYTDTGGTTSTTADGDAVAFLRDGSGNGKHVTQSTSGQRPTVQTVSGKKVLLYDGSDDILVRSNSLSMSNNRVFFIVFQSTKASGNNVSLQVGVDDDSITGGMMRARHSPPGSNFIDGAFSDFSAYAFDTAWQVMVIHQKAADCRHAKNDGALTSAGARTINTFTNKHLYLGGHTTAAVFPFQGYIQRVVGIDAASLSDTTILNIAAHLYANMP